MKLIPLFALAVCVTSAHAAVNPVTLNMRLEMNGKTVSNPRIVLPIGEKGSITESISGSGKSYAIDVESSRESARLLALEVTVTQQEGKRSLVLSKTKVFAENGHTSEVVSRSPDQQHLRLAITPTF